ncbi:MAG TPA: FAD binding domain-containing protein [Burkholderiaceae bacterium]|nr:FAD binding domain-containing protein [Burkholderiaceae bacterium]
MNRFGWIEARSVAQAAGAATTVVADVMAQHRAGTEDEASVVKAGGIDLIDLMKADLLAPARLVNLRHAGGLDGIEEARGGGMRIGALATLAMLAADPALRQHVPALSDAARASASPQIRAVATLGGNLLQRPRCWYFRAQAFHCLRKGGGHCFALGGLNRHHAIFDNGTCAIVHPSTVATVLVALGAFVELAGADAPTRVVLLEDFLVGPQRDVQRENDLRPHEILTAVVLPPLPAGLRMAHRKIAEKESFDWPLADVAATLDLDAHGTCRRAAIVLGAAAPAPRRARAAEALLDGRRIDEEAAAGAARAAIRGATPLAENGYKLALFETLVRRTVLAAAGRSMA